MFESVSGGAVFVCLVDGNGAKQSGAHEAAAEEGSERKKAPVDNTEGRKRVTTHPRVRSRVYPRMGISAPG